MRELPIVFGQQDFLQLLGFSPTVTIAQAGCYLCSFATLARACGKQTDPVDLNTQFKVHKLYVDEDEMLDDNLTKIFPDIIYQESLHYEAIPADLNKLKELLSDPTLWVILEIDLGNNFNHFVLCTGVNGIVSIADPMTKSVIDFATRYGDPAKNILKYVVYKGTPVLPPVEVVNQQPLIDSLRLDRDKNWNLYQDEIKKNDDLTKENTGLQQNIAAVQTRNATLAGEIQKMETEDATAIDKGIKLQGIVTDYQDYLHAIAERVGVSFDAGKLADTTELILGSIDALKRPQVTPEPIQTPILTTEQIKPLISKKWWMSFFFKTPQKK